MDTGNCGGGRGAGSGAAGKAGASEQEKPAGLRQSEGSEGLKASKLVLSPAARDMLLTLHNGEAEMLQPLESVEGGQTTLRSLVQELQAAAHDAYGCSLTCGVALAALEVSRHQPGAAGWPSVESALLCLRRRERAVADARDTRVNVGGRAEGTAQAVTAASAPARAQAGAVAKAGSGPGHTCNAPQSDVQTIHRARADHSVQDLRRKEAARKLRKLLGGGGAMP